MLSRWEYECGDCDPSVTLEMSASELIITRPSDA